MQRNEQSAKLVGTHTEFITFYKNKRPDWLMANITCDRRGQFSAASTSAGTLLRSGVDFKKSLRSGGGRK